MTKRNHTVPQAFLRAWAWDNEKKYVHWRRTGKDKASEVESLQVANVAVRKGFYPDDVEGHFAEHIEQPAGDALKSIRAKMPISLKGKRALAAYMWNLYLRTPRQVHEMSGEFHSKLLTQLRNSTIQEADAVLAMNPRHFAGVDLRMVARLFDATHNEGKVPPHEDYLRRLIEPESVLSSVAVDVLSCLNWTLLVSKRKKFITGDNGVVTNRLGINHEEFYFNIPIAPYLLLCIDRTVEIGSLFDIETARERGYHLRDTDNRAVDTINKRIYQQSEAVVAQDKAQLKSNYLALPAKNDPNRKVVIADTYPKTDPYCEEHKVPMVGDTYTRYAWCGKTPQGPFLVPNIRSTDLLTLEEAARIAQQQKAGNEVLLALCWAYVADTHECFSLHKEHPVVITSADGRMEISLGHHLCQVAKLKLTDPAKAIGEMPWLSKYAI